MKKKDNTEKQNPAQQPEAENVEATAAETAAEAPEESTEAQEFNIEQWQQALETAVKQRDEYLDSLRRSQADFQNFKRRNRPRAPMAMRTAFARASRPSCPPSTTLSAHWTRPKRPACLTA